ncbi:spermidine synthase [Bacillus badius]|uniref:Polyamine aminopropyltransferase n=1 Tax=Bacillus badius TaxID=1455 RepID=A0ABR5APY1_BACBA|nr:fused MFS/spermidine synthase [Bacillus badius]KIL74230.1 Spermidine synthase-like protein [Bacillus badius]KZO00608.1 hypothetical protein A4244_14940 [Bacillus badius]KZR57172.1 hypothetical protein A3781_20160 [Bacillus badius]MED0666938.1 fused MFS/spermidine synthase [Bacillus badius]MED4717284.1 fused MFS/spermidine synthase [Bacillus badius]
MLLPCVKCYCYADQTLKINIGDSIIEESICSSCKEFIQDEIENLIMKWTMDFFGENILFKKKSAYSTIYVSENEEQRNLRFLTSFQSGILKKKEGTSTPYLNSFLLGPIFLNRQIKRILCIGLGTGYLVKAFRSFFPDLKIDVVEIDEEVYHVAKKYFNFSLDSNIDVHILDAFEFVKKTDSTSYDLVALDAYDGNKVPAHLDSAKFYKEINRILMPDGILISNLHGRLTGEHSQDFRNSYNKIEEAFNHSILIPSPNEWEMNILTLSSNNQINKITTDSTVYQEDLKVLIEPWLAVKQYDEKDIKEKVWPSIR